MWKWIRMERISWMEYRTNEGILKMVDEKRSLIEVGLSEADRETGWATQ